MTSPTRATVSTGQLRLTLAAAILSLMVWILLAFVFPVGVGFIHLLLGLGVTLLVRWWALKEV